MKNVLPPYLKVHLANLQNEVILQQAMLQIQLCPLLLLMIEPDDKITSSSIATFGTLNYDVGDIGPGEMVSINPLIYSSSNAAGTLQNLDIQISYGNSIGNRETIDYNLGLVIRRRANRI